MKKFYGPVLNHPLLACIVLMLATAAVGMHMPGMGYDTSVKSFIMEDDPDYAFYNRYKKNLQP